MRIRYIQSACVLIESGQTRVLCDPWLKDGIYYGSWHHYPPLKFTPADLKDIDYIYISHIHPDHFDQSSLAGFPRHVPVVIFDYQMKFLKQNLKALGFQNIIEGQQGVSLDLQGMSLELFAADYCDPEACGKLFGCAMWAEPSRQSQGIDSLAVFSDGRHVIVNHNDAPYYAPTCDSIVAKYPLIDLNLGVYAGASGYPQCFDNLAEDEMMREALRKKYQFLTMLERYTRHLGSQYYLPFAGQYVLGGRLSSLNAYRGVPDLSEVHEFFRLRQKGEVPQEMREAGLAELVPQGPLRSDLVPFGPANQGAWFDVKTGKASELFHAIDTEERERYITDQLSKRSFTYEASFRIDPSLSQDLTPLLRASRRNMMQKQKIYDLPREPGWDSWHVYLDCGQDFLYALPMAEEVVSRAPRGAEREPYLRITLDYTLLVMLLTRHAHWNNASIGSHLRFYRSPNVHNRRLFMLLSFLHV